MYNIEKNTIIQSNNVQSIVFLRKWWTIFSILCMKYINILEHIQLWGFSKDHQKNSEKAVLKNAV